MAPLICDHADWYLHNCRATHFKALTIPISILIDTYTCTFTRLRVPTANRFHSDTSQSTDSTVNVYILTYTCTCTSTQLIVQQIIEHADRLTYICKIKYDQLQTPTTQMIAGHADQSIWIPMTMQTHKLRFAHLQISKDRQYRWSVSILVFKNELCSLKRGVNAYAKNIDLY